MGKTDKPRITRLLIKGDVQGVGYRVYVRKTANKMNVQGTIRNLSDGSVEIFCRSPDDNTFTTFKKALSSGVGDVDSIDEFPKGQKGYGKGPTKWEGFNILGIDMTDLGITMGYVVMGGNRIAEIQENTIKLQMKMLEKQDKTHDAIKTMNKDLSKKQDDTLDAIKAMDNHLNDKFDWLADRYGEFGTQMAEMRQDMSEIKRDIHTMSEAIVRWVDYSTSEKKK